MKSQLDSLHHDCGPARPKISFNDQRTIGFRCLLMLVSIAAGSASVEVSQCAATAQTIAISPPSSDQLSKKANDRITPKNVTVKVRSNKKTYYGKPIAWDGTSKLALLRWDGRISMVPIKSPRLNVFSKGFAPYSPTELKKRLMKQYGDRYGVSESKHFLVVHPMGGAQKNWTVPYESAYGRFYRYFKEREFPLQEPQFPMIVIVLGSRNEFDRELQQEITFKKNVFGFYSRMSNRVTTFVSNDPRKSRNYKKIMTTTTVHETVHQAAFNTGVHNRLCSVPRWLSEGLAMMFEARGVSERKKYPRKVDRINRERLLTLQKMYQSGMAKGKLQRLVQWDKSFESEPQFAYALAWGLTFYLAEKKQKAYFDFLKADAHRQEFLAYPPPERIEDFAKAFGGDFEQLERDLESFILSLPIPLQ